MLVKLMKHEFRATARIFLPLCGALLILSAVTRLLFGTDYDFDSDNFVLMMSVMISIFLYGMMICAIYVMSFFVMVQRFYKNLLGDEGYIMFTLPVRPWQHILSKLLVSIIWMGGVVIVTIASALILSMSRDLFEAIPEILTGIVQFNEFAKFGDYMILLEMFLMILFSTAMGILLIYASISLGQLWNKHKIFGGFIAFIVLSVVSEIIGTILTMGGSNIAKAMGIFQNMRFDEAIHLPFIYVSFLCLLFGGAYYAITHYLLTKKLNLE